MRFLPPLVVLLAFGLVAARCAQHPHRQEAQGQIAGMLEGGEYAAATEALDTYLARYDELEDHWFAAKSWFTMRRPDKAITQIWTHPTLPQAAGTAPRFAEMGLVAMGWTDSARNHATSLEPLALMALVDGGDPWAIQRLRDHARTLELRATTLYFFPAVRQSTRAPLQVLIDTYRTRNEEKFDVAAALAALGPDPYPERAEDLALLRHVVADPKWRQQWLDVWAVSAVALGRSGDPDALRTLKEVEAGLEGASTARDRQALLLLRNGLIAAGEWDAYDGQLAAALAEDAAPMPTLWFLEALIHRYRVGDMRAEAGLVAYWTKLGIRFPNIRDRMARAFLLQDQPPSEEAVNEWVGGMVADLKRPDAPLMARVIARAWLLRQGADGAREKMIETLRTAGAAFQSDPGQLSKLAEPFIEALRALLLYG